MSSNYEKHPYKTIPGYQAYEGYADILAQIQKQRGSLTLPKIIDFHISPLNGLFLLLF